MSDRKLRGVGLAPATRIDPTFPPRKAPQDASRITSSPRLDDMKKITENFWASFFKDTNPKTFTWTTLVNVGGRSNVFMAKVFLILIENTSESQPTWGRFLANFGVFTNPSPTPNVERLRFLFRPPKNSPRDVGDVPNFQTFFWRSPRPAESWIYQRCFF